MGSVDQLLTITANACITIGTIRAVAMGAKKIVRDHIGQLAKLTKVVEDLAAAVARMEQRITALEQLASKGTP